MRKIYIILILLLVSCQPSENYISGYVEGEFIMISPTSAGILETLCVQRGQKVKIGDTLFIIDQTSLMSQQKSIQADIQMLKVGLLNMEKEYDRILALHQTGTVSTSKLDKTKTLLANTNARLKKSEQSLNQINEKLQESSPKASVDGVVQNTFYKPSEYVNVGQPIISLLSPHNVKIRFFIPQQKLSQIELGQVVKIFCDADKKAIKAFISYISSKAEYTPPMIYSVESRSKLVFLVEATLNSYDNTLHPGQPVTIQLKE